MEDGGKEQEDGGVQLRNPYLKTLTVDYLYHFGLNSTQPLKEMFGDVRFVCMGGSTLRMAAFASESAAYLGCPSSENISTTDRFALKYNSSAAPLR
jgi:uridine phosphorylase